MTLENCEGTRTLLREEPLREEDGTPIVKLLLALARAGDDMEEGSDDDELAPCVSGNTVPPIALDDKSGTKRKKDRAYSRKIKGKSLVNSELLSSRCRPTSTQQWREYGTSSMRTKKTRGACSKTKRAYREYKKNLHGS